jgi:hypothetical protein
MSVFEGLKERLELPNTWTTWLKDVADMLDLLLSMDDLTSTFTQLANIKGLPDIIRHIPAWAQQLMESGSAVTT